MSLDEDTFARFAEHLPDDALRPEHRDELRGRALAAYDRAQEADGSTPPLSVPSYSWRMIMSRPIFRLAVAGLLVALVATVGWLVFSASAPVAFADLIKPILEARSAKFKVIVQFKDIPEQSCDMMVLEPSRLRCEASEGVVIINDYRQGKGVSLDTKRKKAIVYDMVNLPREMINANFFDELRTELIAARDDPDVKCQSLGEKEIEGRRAVGYRLSHPAQQTTIWGDRDSGLPILVESTVTMTPDVKVTMRDFTFNVELDESLFSVEPPAGYSVISMQVDASPADEKDLVNTLRCWSDRVGGTFPDALNRPTMGKLVGKLGVKKESDLTDEKMKEMADLSVKIGRGLQFAFALGPEADAHYAGKGVRCDAPNTPVFWYRPKGAEAYRVIYSDLSVRDAATAPDVPSAQPVATEDAPER
ncbi:MAG: LolA family protein [Planctomycetota bacterium]|jgi:outer membrane lipoprotein-sorting protein